VKPTGGLGGADPPAKKTLWQFVLLCIGGGLFTLLMPCTYPMIPITISFFTKQAHKNGKPPIELSLAYTQGIAITYGALGVAMALVGKSLGIQSALQTPWVLVPSIILFLALALSMFNIRHERWN